MKEILPQHLVYRAVLYYDGSPGMIWVLNYGVYSVFDVVHVVRIRHAHRQLLCIPCSIKFRSLHLHLFSISIWLVNCLTQEQENIGTFVHTNVHHGSSAPSSAHVSSESWIIYYS
jgi:hypothetical protein